jgi:crotonobetainyl-CoA:carnitine CoA-transferase CaiB-like acyl-CoA transferase
LPKGRPPWIRPDGAAEIVGESTYYQAVNRNKRCITIDFAQPAGAALVLELASRADVLLENYRSGTLTRYGLGYDALSEANPRLIYCSITGFGQTGPYAQRSGYDYLVQAMAGLMSVTGHGTPNRARVRCASACRSPTSARASTPRSPCRRR